MSNTNTSTSSATATVTEEQIDALLREATDADQQAGDARLWASAEYVNEAQATADAAWVAYRAASASASAATTSAVTTPAATLTTRYHRDGSITLWDIYQQSWVRVRASRVSDEVLATLAPEERKRIAKIAARC